MRTRRILAVLLLLTYAFCAWGFAEPETTLAPAAPGSFVEAQPTLPPVRHILDVSFSASPMELVMPGEVTLNFTVTNTSAYDAENVFIASENGLYAEPIGQLPAGENRSFSRSHTVTQEELDAGRIAYRIVHDGIAGDPMEVEYAVECPVARAYASPAVEFTRRFSTDYAVPGDTVTVLYSVYNAGNVPLTDVRVRDSLGDFTGRAETLEVGETRLFTCRVTVTEKTVSAPELTYSVAGMQEEPFTQALAERTLFIADEQLLLSVSETLIETDADSAEVTLTLRNLGNVDYYDITIVDTATGRLVADGLQSINGSAPMTVSAIFPVRGERTHVFRLTAVSQSGHTVDLVSDGVTIREKNLDRGGILVLSAEADYTVIDRAGEIPVTVRMENTSDALYHDIVLSEASLGELRRFALVAPGVETEWKTTCPVTAETAELTFLAEYVDAGSETRTVRSNPIAVSIRKDGVKPILPEEEERPFEGESVKPRGSSLYLVMLIIASVLLVVLVIALLLSARKARRVRRRKLEQMRRRQQEELGKTNRFTPVKRPDRPEHAERPSTRTRPKGE